MKAFVTPAALTGHVTAPASKSAMQRACAAALLRGGKTVLHNPGVSADDQAAQSIITQLGARLTREDDRLVIESFGIRPTGNRLQCGESGLSVRLFTSLAALHSGALEIEGSGSLVRRPLGFFDEVLPQLGVRVQSHSGHLPLQVQGPLQPRDVEIDGSLSSQFLTGLLFAYSGAGARNVTIRVRGLNSKPYIDLTLQLMKDFGLKVPENRNYESFFFDPSEPPAAPLKSLSYTIEGDWSGGAFLLVAAAIRGNISLKGLDVFSTQADRAILQPLMQAGASMSIRTDAIEVSRSPLKAFHFQATDCPDLFPPLVALAAYCEGTSVIEGVNRLQHKESNRALTLQEEFGKMGVKVELQDDLMIIRGGSPVNASQVQAHHDHRIAMACAVAALNATGTVSIDGAEAVNKSYPQFWEHLQGLGVPISLQTETIS